MKMKIRGLRSEIYNVNDIRDILSKVNLSVVKDNKGAEYINVPVAFDIETTSAYRDTVGNVYATNEISTEKKDKCSKIAFMYIWMLAIKEYVIVGREWAEFVELLDRMTKILQLSDNRKMVIYVHNLSYEFQFMRGYLKIENVFAIDNRRPLRVDTNGMEWRCSYLLSGMSLKAVGETLKSDIRKMTGDLDYSKIRTSLTPLTDEEMGYCVNDVLVLTAYIKEKIESDGDITKIPMTKTGYVRRYVREKTLYQGGDHKLNNDYADMIRKLTITENEYTLLKRAFQGGFTHANAHYVGNALNKAASYDFTSSYPAVLCLEEYPMSKGKKIKIKSLRQLKYFLYTRCCIFDIKFKNIQPKVYFEHPISASRCYVKKNAVIDNGRVVTADEIATTITNVDFEVITKFYTWDSIQIGTLYAYEKGYLPKELLESILELYQQKTTLKGVEYREDAYLLSKEMLNSCYGMMVTDIVRDDIVYSDDLWTTSAPDTVGQIRHYNRSKNRFLDYPWGVFCTAYARRNLFTGIYECADDYVYSDTDSVKVLNAEKHEKYFREYNENIMRKIDKVCAHYDLSKDLFAPKTIKGVEKPMGVWDYEGEYEIFKTLGAKRYAVKKKDCLQFIDDNGEKRHYDYSITVSGINKKIAVPWLLEQNENKFFEKFDFALSVPAGFTGKKTLTYIDDEQSGECIDYMGQKGYYDSRSCIHMDEQGYDMSISKEFLDYLKGVKVYEHF